MKTALIAALVLASLTAFFAVQNAQLTKVTFLGWYFDGPLVIVLLITFATGVVTGLLVMIPGSLRKSLEISRLKSRVEAGGTEDPAKQPVQPAVGPDMAGKKVERTSSVEN
jgi:uncharacterized integral membrane protein